VALRHITFILVSATLIGACSRSHSSALLGDKSSSKEEGPRPSDESESLPGYLIDPGQVSVKKVTGQDGSTHETIVGAKGAVLSPSGSSAGAVLAIVAVVKVWAVPTAVLTGIVGQANQTVSAQLLGSTVTANDGSFSIEVATLLSGTSIVVSVDDQPSTTSLIVRPQVDGHATLATAPAPSSTSVFAPVGGNSSGATPNSPASGSPTPSSPTAPGSPSPSGAAPAPIVTSLTATANPGRIDLTWSGTGKSYLVVRRLNAAPTWVPTAGTSYASGLSVGVENDVVVYADATAAFSDTTVAYGGSYKYAVFATDASLTYSAATTVSGSSQSVNKWTWMAGAKVVNDAGSPGTLGSAAPTNIPPARAFAAYATDPSGNLWLYGGQGTGGIFSDLWRFDGNNWTWIAGSQAAAAPVYGTKGQAASTNTPGARSVAAMASDSKGNLWLFGGVHGSADDRDDLWKFDGTNWTWVGGNSTFNDGTIFGTMGVDSAGNYPSARHGATMTVDANDHPWIFGGYATQAIGSLNDIWRWDGAFAWMGGQVLVNDPGAAGTLNVFSSGGTPMARTNTIVIQAADRSLFWLFGGAGTSAPLNDSWKFNYTGWAWSGGSANTEATASYGSRGVAAANNLPNARLFSSGTRDVLGNYWLFGGNGGWIGGAALQLNDLEKFDGVNWTWASGSNTTGYLGGNWGTLRVGSASTLPSYRSGSVMWSDGRGCLWIYGGAADASFTTAPTMFYDDVWQYCP